MALTKTVNYTQETPQSLGYSAEITGTTGVVTAKIQYNGKMGRLNTGQYGSSYSFLHGDVLCDEVGNEWEIVGTEADVNAALNGLIWNPRTYPASAETQDAFTEHRAVGNEEGEVLFQVEDRISNFNLVVGDSFQVQTAIYTCTKIETTLSGKRIYGVLDLDYSGTSTHLSPITYTSVLINLTGPLTIDNVIDYAIINPHGDSDINIQIYDDAGLHDSGITGLVGSLFVPEPYFLTDAPNTVQSLGDNVWVTFDMGTVAQSNNELISIQLLMKRFVADPLFDGDVPKNKPSYITDGSYGTFSVVQVANRKSRCLPGGIVQWEFYGTPAECNAALSRVRFKPPLNNDRDFYIERRIVNGRSRIYDDRGYN